VISARRKGIIIDTINQVNIATRISYPITTGFNTYNNFITTTLPSYKPSSWVSSVLLLAVSSAAKTMEIALEVAAVVETPTNKHGLLLPTPRLQTTMADLRATSARWSVVTRDNFNALSVSNFARNNGLRDDRRVLC